MIINKAYYGSQYGYRAWFNGSIVWDHGAYADGIHMGPTLQSLMPNVEDMVNVQWHDYNSLGCACDANTNIPQPVTSSLYILPNNISETCNADALIGLFAKKISPIAIGEIGYYGVVFPSGTCKFDELFIEAVPHSSVAIVFDEFNIENVDNTYADARSSDIVVFDELLEHDKLNAFIEPHAQELAQHIASASINCVPSFSSEACNPADTSTDKILYDVSRGMPTTLNVYTVTFICDGEIKHVESVIDGCSCDDPINTGTIETPQRMMTAQYTYKYSGWSLEDDDIVDDNALENITRNMTIYAAFDAAIRSYTARFFVDGVLESSQVVMYGDMAIPPELTKDGYILEWAPSDMVITGNTDFYGTWTRDYILPEQVLQFAYKSDYSLYHAEFKPDKGWSLGEKCVVEWDGVAYVCTSRDIPYKLDSPYIPSATMKNAIGNAKIPKSLFGIGMTTSLADTGEPFLIACASDGLGLYSKDTKTEHTVCIYKF